MFTLSLFLRIFYMIQYMLDKPSYILAFCKLFWKRNQLKKRNTFILTMAFLIKRNALTIIYLNYYYPDDIFRTCIEVLKSPSKAQVLQIPNYMNIFLVICAVLYVYIQKLQDKIGMKIELGITATLLLATVITMNLGVFLFHINSIWCIFAEILIVQLCNTVIPLYFVYKHNKNSSFIQLKDQSYSLNQLKTTSRQLFCEENVLFVENYKNYQANPTDALYNEILDNFINNDALYELNIDEFDRIAALTSPDGLVIVNRHVLDLIENNILPFMDSYQ